MFIALSVDPKVVIEFETDDHGVALRYSIAYCAETHRLVSIVARMAPAFDSQIAQGHFHEFSFEVAVDSRDESFESFATQ